MSPWLPFAFAVGIFIVINTVWFFRRPEMFHVRAFVWIRIMFFALPGAALAVYGALALPHLVADSQLYQTDPSCVAGSVADAPIPPGHCRVARVGLTHAYRYSGYRSGIRYYVTVNFADGTARRVQLAYERDGFALYAGVRETPGTAALAQLFDGKVVVLTSDRGYATTTDLPQYRARNMQFAGGIGIGLMICALLALLVSWNFIVAGPPSPTAWG